MKSSAVLVSVVLIVMLTSSICCQKTFEQQMHQYIEFYYPTSGQYTYNVVFPWGEYVITTGPDGEEKLHPDSEPYRGYITMRPFPSDSSRKNEFPVYLITPEGEVWKNIKPGDIPQSNKREEINTETSGGVTSISTVTIESVSEPVVDDFKNKRQNWKRYGHLKAGSSGKSVLEVSKN